MPFEFDLNVTELNQYQRQLENASGNINLAARAVTAKYTDLIVKEAKRLVPVDTGRLRDSITADTKGEAGRSIATGDIVADAPYAGFVEFGTVRQAPQPFMRPALRKYRKGFKDDLARAGAQVLGSQSAARQAFRGAVGRPGGLSRSTALSRARGNT